MKAWCVSVKRVEVKVIVDSPDCQGRASCHELVPEAFDLDDDGYPVVTYRAANLSAADPDDPAAGSPELAITVVP